MDKKYMSISVLDITHKKARDIAQKEGKLILQIYKEAIELKEEDNDKNR